MANQATDSVDLAGGGRKSGGLLSKRPSKDTILLVAPIIGVIVLYGVFALITDRFVTLQNIMTILRHSSILWVVMVSSTLVILTGSIDLSVEGNMILSMSVISVLMANEMNGNNFGLWVIPIAIALSSFVGLANGLVYAKLRVPSFVSTLGVWFVTMGAGVFIIQGTMVVIKDNRLSEMYAGSFLGIPYTVYIGALIVAVAYVVLRYTRFGRYLFAVGGGEDIATMRGVPVVRTKILAFFFAGLLLGIAAVLNSARLGMGTVQIGLWLFPSLTAVVIGGTAMAGGRGGVIRGVMGALFVSVLANGMIHVGLSTWYQQLAQGALLLCVVALTFDRKKAGLIR